MVEKARANVYLNPSIKDEAVKLANELGISFSALVNIALSEYIKQNSIKDMAEFFKKIQQLDIEDVLRR